MAREVARWQTAMRGRTLAAGGRVAIQLRNCPEWVMFDQAALSLGLVTVPLYTDDRPDNIAYILSDGRRVSCWSRMPGAGAGWPGGVHESR